MFDCAAYLDTLNMFGIRLGLDAVRELFSRAGHPEKKLTFLHIAGTNGKGSTGAMLERALRQVGFRTGFYTSPHLIDVRERFRIDGKAVDVDTFNRLGAELAAESGSGQFSYFEFATVLAAKIFVEAGCQAVIWETGMGGRLDATNAVLPAASIITGIALDHQNHLGSTLEAIAGEKAGIIKPEVPVFLGSMPECAANVLKQRAAELHSPLFEPSAPLPEEKRFYLADNTPLQEFDYQGKQIALSLAGRMQRENFRTVFEVLRYFSSTWHFDLDAALAGLRSVRWPARLQFINDRIILDGGHNPDGVGALVHSVQELFPGERFTIVYAAFGDKHAENCLPLLKEIASDFVFTELGADGRASHTAQELCAMCGAAIPCTTAPDATSALDLALKTSSHRVIVSGSLYMAGTILQKWCPLDTVLNVL